MTERVQRAEDRLLRNFERDLCTCTEEMIYGRWKGPQIKALEKLKPGYFDQVIRKHNPIYYIGQRIWFANDPSLLTPSFHRDILCKELLDHRYRDPQEVDGLLAVFPRDSFKTTHTHGVFVHYLVFNAWWIDEGDLLAERPPMRQLRIMLRHHKERQASKNLIRIRQKSTVSDPSKETDPGKKYLHEVWPEFTSREEKALGNSTELDWPNKPLGIFSEPSIFASGLTQKQTGWHFDWILNSDLVTEDHRKFPTIRRNAILDYEASRYLLDSECGREVNDGTFYHANDLWAKCVEAKDPEGEPMYRVVVRGAGGEETGEPLLQPMRHTEAFLTRKRSAAVARTGNDILHDLQYQCLRRAAHTKAGDSAWIRPVDSLPKGAATVILCDPAWKGSHNAGKGDDAAIWSVGLIEQGPYTLIYLCDLILSDELTGGEGKTEILRMARRWGAKDVGVEERGGFGFTTELVEEAQRFEQMIEPIRMKTQQTPKEDRIVNFLGLCQAGRVSILKSCRNQDKFLDQVDAFPENLGPGEKVDALDCAAYSADPDVLLLAGDPDFRPYVHQDAYIYEPQVPRRTFHTRV